MILLNGLSLESIKKLQNYYFYHQPDSHNVQMYRKNRNSFN